MRKFLLLLALCTAVGMATPALAEDPPAASSEAAPAEAAPAEAAPAEAAPEAAPTAEAPKIDTGSTAWMITATVLVILMTVPGLALFYGGLVRSKNMLSVLMQVFVTFSLLSVLWALYAYSLAFKEGSFNAIVGGFSHAFLAGIKPDTVQGAIPEYVFMTFQLTFAAITPALIIGAFAERM
jgi:Amt family ammonium transporter